jgi:predicted dehydrogenase
VPRDVGFVTMGRVAAPETVAPTIGVGVLGYAFMGKAHANAYQRMPVFFYPPPAQPRLVAVCGRTEPAVAAAATRYGFERYHRDWTAVVQDANVELVDNCLPNHLHAAPCIAAVEAGKHVLCEKPLARSVAEAKAVASAAARAGVKHMTGFNYRFLPAIRLAKRMITRGDLGTILQFRAAYLQEWIMNPDFPLVWRLQRGLAGSGALGDLGSHIIDLARYLVGELAAVCALTETFVAERPRSDDPSATGRVDVDDAFIALTRFHGGAVGSLEASRFCAGRKNYQRIEIHGTEGSLSFNLERLNELRFYSRRDREDAMGFRNVLVTESSHPYMAHWWPQGHIIGWEHTFVHEVHHLLDCIANDRPVAPVGATFDDGLRCQEVMRAIADSAQQARWVTLPR